MVTRRQLLITISLLAVLDLATAFWYVTGHIGDDGRYVGVFSSSDSTAATAADTLPNALHVKFAPIRNEIAYYVSASTFPASSGSKHFTCVKQAKLKMPHSINGSTTMNGLSEAIVAKAFGARFSDPVSASAAFVKSPEFNMGGTANYSKVAHPIVTQHTVGREHRVKAFPYLASNRLLEYEIYASAYDGHTLSERVGFVLYDCMSKRVLKPDFVLRIADKAGVAEVLKMVNDRIDFVKKRDGQKLRHAKDFNAEVAVEPRGIKLAFPSGSVAEVESGVTYVFLPYKTCGPILTDEFKQLLATDANYHHYNVMKFGN